MPLTAQRGTTGYFLEGNLYRHDLNPAFANQKDYVAVPGLGNVTMDFRSDLGLDDILFIRDGRTVTFLHPDVSADDFLSGIDAENRLSEDFQMQLLGVGFKSGRKSGRYTSMELNLRQNMQVNLPGDLFELAKNGLRNRVYDLSSLRLRSEAYAELALGHSISYKDKFRLGAKLKVLMGLAACDVEFDKARIQLGQDGYVAETDGEVHVAVKGFEYHTTTEDFKTFENNQLVSRPRSYIDDAEVESPGPNGFGAAIDLGAVFQLNKTWQFSASIQDLGLISWKEDHVAEASGRVSTNDYEISLDDDDYNALENTIDVLADDLAKLAQLQPAADGGSYTRFLVSTARAGVEYTAPFYRKLKFGLLGTARFAKEDVWTDVRLSANVAPLHVLSVAASAGMGSFGFSYGGCFNLHVWGVNFFMGADCIADSFTKEMIPLAANASFDFGLNAQF